MERASERGRRAVDNATEDGSSTQRRLLTVLMSVHIDLSSSTLLIVKYQNYQLPLQFSSSFLVFRTHSNWWCSDACNLNTSDPFSPL